MCTLRSYRVLQTRSTNKMRENTILHFRFENHLIIVEISVSLSLTRVEIGTLVNARGLRFVRILLKYIHVIIYSPGVKASSTGNHAMRSTLLPNFQQPAQQERKVGCTSPCLSSWSSSINAARHDGINGPKKSRGQVQIRSIRVGN